MITDFYGLEGEPFGATPDSRYLFESGTHREALASLLYGVEAGRGFMALIAKPGMGKTTLLFRALSQLREQGRTVFLFQTMLTPLDLLRTLLADLGVQDLQGGVFELQAKLNEILVEYSSRSERLVIVIDETQNLDDSVLEMVRMLSNFETQQQKLMQIILSGQPQLAQKLASPNLVQLRQRISIIAHLQPFLPEEIEQYVEHRLQVAGYSAARPLFTRSAMRLIAQQSEGIPRNINTLCFNALSIGCALKRKSIDVDIVREVISDLDLAPLGLSTEAAPSEGTAAEKTAAAPPVPSRPPFAGWAIKGALATALLLVLSGIPMSAGHHIAVFADAKNATSLIAKPAGSPATPPGFFRRQAMASADARKSGSLAAKQATALVPAASPERPHASAPAAVASAPPAVHELQLDARERILVPPGVTLYEICRETMKGCHAKQINAIRRLNPWLTDPNHLESGRKLQMPPLADVATDQVIPAVEKVNREVHK
jgi:general secretion pathway protein A